MKGTEPFYSTNAWRMLRMKTLKRDNWHCVVCHASVRGKGESRVDHIVSRTKAPGLAFVLANLRTLCVGCDAKRHSEKGGNHVERVPIAIDGLPASWR